MPYPLLHVRPERPRANYYTLLALCDLIVDAEKRLACGPMDEYDEVVLRQWVASARQQFRRACVEVFTCVDDLLNTPRMLRMTPGDYGQADYEIVDGPDPALYANSPPA